jgi:hypothetical protein
MQYLACLQESCTLLDKVPFCVVDNAIVCAQRPVEPLQVTETVQICVIKFPQFRRFKAHSTKHPPPCNFYASTYIQPKPHDVSTRLDESTR